MSKKQWLIIAASVVVFLVAITIGVVLRQDDAIQQTTYEQPVAPVPVEATKIIEDDYNELVAQSLRTQVKSYVAQTNSGADISDLKVTRLSATDKKTIYDMDFPSAKQNYIAIVEVSPDGYNNPSVKCPEGEQKKYDTRCEVGYHGEVDDHEH